MKIDQKGFIPIVIAILILVLAVAAVVYKNKDNFSKSRPDNPTVSQNQPTQTQPGISDELGLIKLDLYRERIPVIKYFQKGVIPEGKYKGYKRIIAMIKDSSIDGPFLLIFATQDDKQYVLNGNSQDAIKYPEDDYKNPLQRVRKEKITAVDDLESGTHPQTINIDDKFALFRENIYFDKNANSESIETDFSNYPSLTSDNPKFKFYTKKPEALQLPYNPTFFPEAERKNYEDAGNKYLGNTIGTEVIVVDNDGLGFSYQMTTPQAVATYIVQKAQYDKDMLAYYATNSNLKKYPDPVLPPSWDIAKKAVVTSLPLFNSYGKSFPHGCESSTGARIITNLKDDELIKAGIFNNIELFTLADKNHPLNKIAYGSKISYYGIGFTGDTSASDTWDVYNKGLTKPTFEEYAAKNPLVFFKDTWGRWLAVGEWDYKLPGGCGKPVIYLYPSKPTQVSVQFASPMKLDVDIPTYENGWKVLANPDGTLKDLQPEKTDCNKIDAKRKGSEYAKEACLTQTYPYLYWAGRSLVNKYPEVKGGWFVKKEDLDNFMDNKLNEIGLNSKEKSDMLSYWIPEMLGKNAPYYKIAFLQTQEMNNLIPMRVSPQPDTVFRIFLDYTPLDSQPSLDLQPQSLVKLNRVGFTLVEWGGLKR